MCSLNIIYKNKLYLFSDIIIGMYYKESFILEFNMWWNLVMNVSVGIVKFYINIYWCIKRLWKLL